METQHVCVFGDPHLCSSTVVSTYFNVIQSRMQLTASVLVGLFVWETEPLHPSVVPVYWFPEVKGCICSSGLRILVVAGCRFPLQCRSQTHFFFPLKSMEWRLSVPDFIGDGIVIFCLHKVISFKLIWLSCKNTTAEVHFFFYFEWRILLRPLCIYLIYKYESDISSFQSIST